MEYSGRMNEENREGVDMKGMRGMEGLLRRDQQEQKGARAHHEH